MDTMANSYTHFSFVFKIRNPREAEYLETILQAADDVANGEDDADLELVREVFGEDFEDYGGVGFQCNITGANKKQEVWIHDDGGEGNVEFAANFVQAYMAKFKVKKPIAIEFAVTCDAPRPGEFGGGAVILTATDAHWFNTAEWIREKLAEIGKGK